MRAELGAVDERCVQIGQKGSSFCVGWGFAEEHCLLSEGCLGLSLGSCLHFSSSPSVK